MLLNNSINIGKLGAPEKSRTPNLQIRSLALYPIELRALLSFPYFFYLAELLNKFEYHMSTTNLNLFYHIL